MHAVSKMSPMVLPPMFNGGSDDHVTCRMCLIRFSYPARLPLSLHCLHTYCSQCVFSWTCNKTKSKLSCPMCGKMTKIDKGKKVQECLPINHAVLELANMSSGQRDYQNGFSGQEQSQPFYHATQFNNLSPSSCDHGASNLHLPSRFQSASPAKFIHAGHEHINGLNVNGSAQQTPESSCSLALESSKIYPDLPANQPSRSEVCNPCSGAAQWSNKPTDNCAYNGYDAEKQTSTCCNTNSACPPAPTKVQPGLQINIGSVRFQNRQEDKENENSSNGRHDSPCGMIENLKPAGAVTELCVNRSPRIAKRLPEVPKISCIPKINSDLCVRCNVNPASVTITSERSVQRLCSDCHAASKEDKKCEDRDSRQRPVINEPPNNQARTVVKVQSKLNGESARCSPVWDPKTRQPVGESERKVDTSLMSSVLRLGDPVRTAAASPIVCSNQVGVICGPFKSEQMSKTGGGETDVRCSEASGVTVCSGRVETSNGGQSVGKEETRARTTENSNAVSTAIDFGTIDQVKVLKKTSRDARTEVRTEVAAVNPRRSQPVVSNTRPTGRQEAGFRPREYVVGPAGMGVDSRGNGRAERGNRASDVLLSVEELNRPAAFNPQYSDDFDTRSVSDLGLPTVEPVNLMQRATTKEQEAMGYSNNQSSPQYPTLSSPPRYEDIMAEAKLHGVPPGGGAFIPRFGRYGESSSHPGALRNPSRVSVSQDDRVAVADTHNKTVQVFGGQSGECMSLMRVDGVTGCCIARDGSIVVATNKGIEVYKANGVLNKKVDDMGSVINVAAYRNGFVAAQSKALVAFRDMNGGTSKTLTDMWKSGQYHHNKSFQNITDVAVNSQQDFIVLESGTIYILTDEGSVRFVLKPHHQPCGPLTRPTSLDVDERNNIVVCDGRRVLLFNAGGQYIRDIFEPITRGMLLGAGPELAAVTPQALGLGRNGRVYIAIKGDRTAEVIVLSYL